MRKPAVADEFLVSAGRVELRLHSKSGGKEEASYDEPASLW